MRRIASITRFPLDELFRPRSVAVVGASPRETEEDGGLHGDLEAIGFDVPIDTVNRKYVVWRGRLIPQWCASLEMDGFG